MMRKHALFTGIVFLLALQLAVAGCQSTEPLESGAPEKPVPLVPFSKGPDGPPSVKGPSGPPPGANGATQETPQAVTETEMVRYTLPGTPTVEVKQ